MKIAIFVDPFNFSKDHIKSLRSLLQEWKINQFEFYYLSSKGNQNVLINLMSKNRKKRNFTEDDVFASFLKEFQDLGPIKGEIIWLPEKTKSKAQKAAQMAKKEKFDLVISMSYSRSFLSRFFLGSFTDQLLASSQVPVLSWPPGFVLKSKETQFLFAYDLDRKQEKVVFNFLNQIKFLNGVLSIHYVAEPWFNEKLSGIDKSVDKDREKLKKEIKNFSNKLKTTHSKVNLHVTHAVAPLVTQILDVAHKNKQDIVVATLKKSKSSKSLGGIVGQLVRQNDYPVIILRQKKG